MAASPELALLLACCRARPNAQDLRARIAGVTAWPRFAERAMGLELGPLVHARLREAALHTALPEAIAARLAAAYLAQAAQNARRHARVEAVITRLQAHDIPVLLLKGAALAEPVYGNLALRSMVDVDLLMPADAVDRAYALIRADDYTPFEEWQPEAWYTETHHHLAPLVAPDRSVTLELHRDLHESDARVSFPAADLWTRAVPLRIGMTDALGLDPHDLLLHLAIHLVLSSYTVGHLRTLCDIAQVIEHHHTVLDWNVVVERARTARAARLAAYPLRWARALVGADVPVEVLRQLETGGGRRGGAHVLYDRTARRLLCRPAGARAMVPAWFWNGLLARWRAAPSSMGLVPAWQAIYRHLYQSARRAVPGLGPLLPLYAVTVTPLASLFRALRNGGTRS